MYPLIKFKITTPRRRNSISTVVAGLLTALACFALSPAAQALLPPPAPDGGYLNGNTAEGDGALFSLTTGDSNTAIGNNALYNNSTGFHNTANGFGALFSNTTGANNTASGLNALASNTTGGSNTANGFAALANNTTGDSNTANGFQALIGNTTGDSNTANGFDALFFNKTGFKNTANGVIALWNNTTGFFNTASGFAALANNTTGDSNIALGFEAGSDLTTGDNNIDIGNKGVAGESNTIRIGTVPARGIVLTRTFIAGITSVAITGSAVHINSSGQLGVPPSSHRFKDEIKPMDKASEAILALKPVTFHYKKELDPEGIPQFGLVAEDVEKVSPTLITRDADGKPYTVRYEAINAMLLNEFLKEHRKVERLEAALEAVNQRLKEQDAQIQKVSAQLAIGKSAPQMVGNNQ
jgi:hypothetical protein